MRKIDKNLRVKVRVQNKEECVRAQEAFFALGAAWYGDGTVFLDNDLAEMVVGIILEKGKLTFVHANGPKAYIQIQGFKQKTDFEEWTLHRLEEEAYGCWPKPKGDEIHRLPLPLPMKIPTTDERTWNLAQTLLLGIGCKWNGGNDFIEYEGFHRGLHIHGECLTYSHNEEPFYMDKARLVTFYELQAYILGLNGEPAPPPPVIEITSETKEKMKLFNEALSRFFPEFAQTDQG